MTWRDVAPGRRVFPCFETLRAKKRWNPFTERPEWSYFSMGDSKGAWALADLCRGSPRET